MPDEGTDTTAQKEEETFILLVVSSAFAGDVASIEKLNELQDDDATEQDDME